MSGGSRSSFREDNANGARAKSEGSIPITGDLVRCYSDYMHEEYGELDSDYVFVNLWAGRIGQPMSSDGGRRPGAPHPREGRVSFHAAHARHTYVTLAMRGKVPLEVISRLVTHTRSRRRAARTCILRLRICARRWRRPGCSSRSGSCCEARARDRERAAVSMTSRWPVGQLPWAEVLAAARAPGVHGRAYSSRARGADPVRPRVRGRRLPAARQLTAWPRRRALAVHHPSASEWISRRPPGAG